MTYSLLNINYILDKLGRFKYFTTLDLANKFHQFEMDKDDISDATFRTYSGHYKFNALKTHKFTS